MSIVVSKENHIYLHYSHVNINNVHNDNFVISVCQSKIWKYQPKTPNNQKPPCKTS